MIRLIALIITTLMFTGCSTTLDILAYMNTPNHILYDEGVCENGEATPPGVTRRQGCVNDKTKTENYRDYDLYLNERELNNQ